MKLLPAPRCAGLLTDGREAQVRRLVHSLYLNLELVRKEKSPSALWTATRILRELNTLGFAAVVLQKGKIVGAEDPRFRGRELTLPKEPLTPSDPFLRLKAQIEALPLERQQTLLAELRLKWRKEPAK